MGDQLRQVSAASNQPQWNDELVFNTLNNSIRRELLKRMAIDGPLPAALMHSGKEHQFCGLLKHLSLMCESGLVVKTPNRADNRKPIYGLSPAVSVSVTDNEVILDLAHCLFRLTRTPSAATQT